MYGSSHLQHDALEQLDQLRRQVGVHERLHGGGNLVRVLRLGERRLHHLLDQGAPRGRLLGLALGLGYTQTGRKGKGYRTCSIKGGQ